MMLAKRINKEKVKHTLVTLRYSLYLITHPMDGFWDLSREKRGSLAAANIIIILTLLTSIWKIQFTSFLFMSVYWDKVNILSIMAGIIIPLLIGCLSNWSLTTLFEGKGTMKDIYIAVGYAMMPYVLLQIPMIIFSNVVTADEGAFYFFFDSFSMIWCGVLILAAVMMVHDFSFGKAIGAIIATVAGMIVIIFLFLMFFSLVSDGFAYFTSLYKEIAFRFY